MATIYLILTIVLSFLLFYLFFGGNIIVYTPNQGTNGEKYFSHIFYKGKMPTLAGNKHLSVHFFLDGQRPSPLSMEKVWVQSVKNGHHSVFSRTDTINKNMNT